LSAQLAGNSALLIDSVAERAHQFEMAERMHEEFIVQKTSLAVN
jgi:hypothetical protein